MDVTLMIGSIGLLLSLWVAPPQIIKTLKTKDVTGISKTTYTILCIVMVCFFIRAVAIKEWLFILSNGIGIFVNGFQLLLIYKYAP